jgi:acetyl-CoA carboxylase carboxyl transferase subunit alpha
MAVSTYLEFEKPVADLEKKIAELEAAGGAAVEDEVTKLREKANKQLENIYTHLTAWQKTQVARHPERPHFLDYVEHLFEEFVELAGDRKFMNDDAILGGLARFRGKPVVVIGHEKGRDTQTRLKHNFGMGKPEGYRKAVRLIELAGRFGLPVIALVDTSGAFPGKGGEERGQAEALARSIEGVPHARYADDLGHRGRGRFGRRGGAGLRKQGADDGARRLFSDLAGRRRVHPVPRRQAREGHR